MGLRKCAPSLYNRTFPLVGESIPLVEIATAVEEDGKTTVVVVGSSSDSNGTRCQKQNSVNGNNAASPGSPSSSSASSSRSSSGREGNNMGTNQEVNDLHIGSSSSESQTETGLFNVYLNFQVTLISNQNASSASSVRSNQRTHVTLAPAGSASTSAQRKLVGEKSVKIQKQKA